MISKELALQSTQDDVSLLSPDELVHIVRPSLALVLQVVHCVSHDSQLLRPLVQLPRQILTPALLCLRCRLDASSSAIPLSSTPPRGRRVHHALAWGAVWPAYEEVEIQRRDILGA